MGKIEERGKTYALHKASDKLNDYYGSAMLNVVQFDGHNIQCAYIDGYLQAEQDLKVKDVDLEKEVEDWVKTGPHTSYPWCTIPDAIRITAEHFFELGLNTRKNKILTKEEKLHLPSGVDEAAWKYGIDNQMGIATQSEKVNAFIAGAEWMAKQGETLYDYINVDGKNQRWLGENLLQGEYDAGQAVIVQIRKV